MVDQGPQCAELGLQFGNLMSVASTEDRTAAEAMGLIMDKTVGRATINISKQAAEEYFDPTTGNTLGWILDEITTNNCAGELDLTVSKMSDGSYLVIQKFNPNT